MPSQDESSEKAEVVEVAGAIDSVVNRNCTPANRTDRTGHGRCCLESQSEFVSKLPQLRGSDSDASE